MLLWQMAQISRCFAYTVMQLDGIGAPLCNSKCTKACYEDDLPSNGVTNFVWSASVYSLYQTSECTSLSPWWRYKRDCCTVQCTVSAEGCQVFAKDCRILVSFGSGAVCMCQYLQILFMVHSCLAQYAVYTPCVLCQPNVNDVGLYHSVA